MAETTRASKPIFSRAAGSKTVKDYLAQLDELTRRNKGGFSAVAEETGSSIPFMLPGRAVKSGVPEMPQRQLAQLPQPEEYVIPEQEPYPQGDVQGAQTQGMSGQQFIDQLNQSLGTKDSLYLTGTGSSGDGGTILTNGETIYPSGNIKTPEGQDVFADGSAPGGGLHYSDGQIRYIDPSTPGLAGLMDIIFGQQQQVTQEYGNYNPGVEPGSGYNTGTDIRTRDLQSKAFSLPFETKVLQIFKDDGTRFGDVSGHQGYGNSVLIQLPSGQAIRLSHLADMGQFQEGQSIPGGTYVGTFGQTGNTYGEHLDLEYYNQDGQKSDPSTFRGEDLKQFVTQPETITQSGNNQPIQQSSQPPQEQTQSTQQPQDQSTQGAQSTGGLNGSEKLKQAAAAFGYTANLANPTLSAEEKAMAKQESDKALTGIGFDPRGTIGAQELLMGDVPAAGREVSQTIERKDLTPGFDVGISELLRGDVEGAKNVFKDTAGRVINKVSEVIAPKVGAVESVPQQEPQSDEGIKRLQSKLFGKGGSGVNLFSKPDPSDIAGQRAVGDVSGGSLLPFAPSDAISDRAISQDISQSNNPQIDQSAIDLDNLRKAYMARYGDAHAYDQNDLQRKLSMLKPGDTLQSLGEPQLTAQFRQEEQQRIGGEQARVEAEQRGEVQAGSSYGQPQTQNRSDNSAQSMNNIANYATGNIGQQLSQPKQQQTPVYQPYQQTQELMRSVPNPAPQQNIFQKVGSAITNSNLFKRWFQ